MNGELLWPLVESTWRFIKKKTCINCLVDENPDAIIFRKEQNLILMFSR